MVSHLKKYRIENKILFDKHWEKAKQFKRTRMYPASPWTWSGVKTMYSQKTEPEVE